jgi:hypothetical protein
MRYQIGDVIGGWKVVEYQDKTDDYTIEKDGQRKVVLASYIDRLK